MANNGNQKKRFGTISVTQGFLGLRTVSRTIEKEALRAAVPQEGVLGLSKMARAMGGRGAGLTAAPEGFLGLRAGTRSAEPSEPSALPMPANIITTMDEQGWDLQTGRRRVVVVSIYDFLKRTEKAVVE